MPTIDDQGRTEPPLDGDEVAAALGFLDYQRSTLEWKCAGAGRAVLDATLPASAMTLGGLLNHLAWVEDYWFSVRLRGNPEHADWAGVDWSSDPDWEWTSAARIPPDELLERWRSAVGRSRRHTNDALAEGGFDVTAASPTRTGDVPNLRWIVLHMIEEYARHNGHADLLREHADGCAIGE